MKLKVRPGWILLALTLASGLAAADESSGSYRLPQPGLIPVELYHQDGYTAWTWDGRGTPFPSRALDFQLYSPQALNMGVGSILDTEDLSSEELAQFGLQRKTSSQLSNHRPLVVEYTWFE